MADDRLMNIRDEIRRLDEQQTDRLWNGEPDDPAADRDLQRLREAERQGEIWLPKF